MSARNKPISDRLREAIADSGKTVYAVAKESGVSHPVLGRFLRGERGINIETADRLAEFFRLRLVSDARSKAAAKR